MKIFLLFVAVSLLWILNRSFKNRKWSFKNAVYDIINTLPSDKRYALSQGEEVVVPIYDKKTVAFLEEPSNESHIADILEALSSEMYLKLRTFSSKIPFSNSKFEHFISIELDSESDEIEFPEDNDDGEDEVFEEESPILLEPEPPPKVMTKTAGV